MPEWIQIVLRTLSAVIVLFALTRLLGKRHIAQLTYFEYITGIALGSMAVYISFAMKSGWYLGYISLIVWAGFVLLISFLELKSKTIREWSIGKGTILIKDGKVMEDNLKKMRYNTDEMLKKLRERNAFSIADVEFAVLETSGELSVLLKKENQPITPKMLGIKTPNIPEPQTVIMDGEIMDEPLATIGRSRGWLRTELEKQGVALENVYLAEVNAYGELHVDLYDDQIQLPSPQPRAMLLALLKKCAADIELFALSTKNEAAKAAYEQSLKKMNKLIPELTPYLKS